MAWARPVLKRGVRKALPLIGLLAGACAEQRDILLVVEDSSYRFPASDVRSAVGEDHQFVRVRPADLRFDLIYDSRIAGKTDRDDWPQVFSLNDEGKPNVDRHIVGDLKVVCRRAVNPRSGCGIEVRHRGISWNARFPRKDKLHAQRIERQAIQLLEHYAQ